MTIRPDDRVLITGAASGLGLAFTTQLAERGCRVLATDLAEDRPASLESLDVDYRRLDVTSDVDWAAARDHVVEAWDGLDALFNNAGVAAGGRIELTEIDQWQWIVEVNLLSVARGCRTFTPLLKEQRRGHIVNIASAAGIVHPPRMTEYCATKAGVVALSESLFHELKPFEVDVSVVCPTFFKTNLIDSWRGKDPSAQETASKLVGGSKRTPDDIAATVLKQVDRGRHLIIPTFDGRAGYLAKRLVRPLYYREMAKAAVRMARKD